MKTNDAITTQEEQALAWWNKIELPKQVMLASRYLNRTALSLTAQEIKTIWNSENGRNKPDTNSKRVQSLTWWNGLTPDQKESFCLSYRMDKYNERSLNYHSLTGNEIEEIWTKAEKQENFDPVLAERYLSKFSLDERYDFIALGLLTLTMNVDEINAVLEILVKARNRKQN